MDENKVGTGKMKENISHLQNGDAHWETFPKVE
jgi:hypothetical protein